MGGGILAGRAVPCQGGVSRHLKCYRAGIVAPLAMLLSSHYGESHRECARQARIRGSHLPALPAGEAGRETADPGRGLPRRGPSSPSPPFACHRPPPRGGARPPPPRAPPPRPPPFGPPG